MLSKVVGLNKMSLIDYPDHIVATLFTQGCDFKCPYCHNPELITQNVEDKYKISYKNIKEFFMQRKNKLDGVAITGGEPLKYSTELKELLSWFSYNDFKIKIDTNGFYPYEIKDISTKGLVDYWAMDIKAPIESYRKYGLIKTDTNLYKKIIDSIKRIIDSKADYEFRTTVVPEMHNILDIEKISKQLSKLKANNYYIQNFRNKSKNNVLNENKVVDYGFSEEKLESFKNKANEYIDNVNIRN